MSTAKNLYGTMPDGRKVYSFEIRNSSGTGAQIISLGATLDKLYVKNANGDFIDVLVGFDDLQGHLSRSDYQGVVVGQYANRIKNGEFFLDGRKYSVSRNENDKTCLHGGNEYSGAVWDGYIIDDKSVSFTYFSPDMTNGFPGNVKTTVTYTLSEDNSLVIDYKAVTDRETIINLTNHAYFNLNGFDKGTILNHELLLNCDYYTPIDSESIPLGNLEPVKGTPFSFLKSKKIGKDIEIDCEQLKNGQGYDHNFCINGYDGTLKTAAIVKSSESGITMTVKTTLPGVQLYTGNFLKGAIGKNGIPINRRTAFCLETQYYPDTPNNPDFPPCVFSPETPYMSTTIFSFTL